MHCPAAGGVGRAVGAAVGLGVGIGIPPGFGVGEWKRLLSSGSHRSAACNGAPRCQWSAALEACPGAAGGAARAFAFGTAHHVLLAQAYQLHEGICASSNHASESDCDSYSKNAASAGSVSGKQTSTFPLPGSTTPLRSESLMISNPTSTSPKRTCRTSPPLGPCTGSMHGAQIKPRPKRRMGDCTHHSPPSGLQIMILGGAYSRNVASAGSVSGRRTSTQPLPGGMVPCRK